MIPVVPQLQLCEYSVASINPSIVVTAILALVLFRKCEEAVGLRRGRLRS